MEYRAIIKNGFVYQVGRLITWNNNWSIKELEAAWNSVTTYRGGMGERKEVQEGGVHTHTHTHTHTHNCDCFALSYGRNQHSTVKQLFTN